MPSDKLNDFIRDHREELDTETPPASLWERIADALPEADGDPLADFITTNREAFDTATPPPRFPLSEDTAPAPAPKLRLRSSRRRALVYISSIAAGLLLLFTAYQIGSTDGYSSAKEERIAQELQRVNPDFVEAESFYRHQIQTEYARVISLNDDPQLRQDMEILDRATADIRAQLLDVPTPQRPQLVNQLIDNYRTKLDILLQIQRHLQTKPNGPSTPQNLPTNES